jgi:hypothetical protein
VNSEKRWKIQRNSKLNSEKIGKWVVVVVVLFNLLFFHIFPIFSLFNLLFFISYSPTYTTHSVIFPT